MEGGSSSDLKNWARFLSGWMLLPAVLAHEICHAVVAAPWADELTVSVESGGDVGAGFGADWSDDEPPTYAVLLTAYAPAILGALAGIWGVLRLVSEGVPREPTSLATLGVLAIWWAIFMWPSLFDRARAAEARETTHGDTDA